MINTADLGIKPLALASGHGRYITVTPERTFFRQAMAVTRSRNKLVTVSLPKRLRDGRFISETATWTQKWLNKSIGASRKL
jgi:hypothetical protein